MTFYTSLILVIGVTAAAAGPGYVCPNLIPKCWFILDEPSGLTNFNISIDSGKVVTGIFTINGQIISHPPSRTQSDYLELITFQDPDGLNNIIIELELQVGREEQQNAMFVRGVKIRSDTSGRPFHMFYPGGSRQGGAKGHIIHPDAEGSGDYWIYPGDRIRIQISDLNGRHEYKLYFGDSENALLFIFNYGSEENWQKFKNLRLNATRKVINKDENLLTSYTSMSVCSDPQPVLCGDSIEVIKPQQLGEPLTLRCSGGGAPYLTSRWEDNNGTSISDFHQVVYNDTADNHIESVHVIESFEVGDIGKFACTLYNINFHVSVNNIFSVEYSRKAFIIRSPKEVFSSDEEMTKVSWLIDGWPFDAVNLECENETEFGLNISKDIFSNYKPVPRVEITLSFRPETVPDALKCSLMDGSRILEEHTLRKYDKGNTSVKSSTKLFVIRSAKEFFEPSSDEKITNVSWLIEGWPFDAVYLDCEKETDLGSKDVGKEIFLDYRLVPLLKLTLSFPPRTVPDAFNCNLMDGSRILEEHTFRKYDKGNTSDIAVAALIVAIAVTFVAICAVTVILFKPDLFKNQHISVRVATHAQGNDDSDGDSVTTPISATTPITFTYLDSSSQENNKFFRKTTNFYLNQL